MDLEPVREVGATVAFDCPNCGFEVVVEIGGPGDNHWENIGCSNEECDASFSVRLEVEPE